MSIAKNDRSVPGRIGKEVIIPAREYLALETEKLRIMRRPGLTQTPGRHTLAGRPYTSVGLIILP